MAAAAEDLDVGRRHSDASPGGTSQYMMPP